MMETSVMHRCLVVALSCALVACQATPRADTTVPTADVSLTLDRTSYTAGATATMRIRNSTNDTFGFNACSSRTIERQNGSSWTPHSEPDRMCTMELRLLQPKETQSAATDLPSNLTPGTYRMVLTLSLQGREATGGGVRAVSPTFRIE
jgi:hypothetical protein